MIFSPPYFNAIKKGGEGPNADNQKISYKERVKRFQGYSTDKGNIGNTGNYGGVFHSIVFSPPYFCSISDIVKSRCGYPITKKACVEGKSIIVIQITLEILLILVQWCSVHLT